MPTVPVARMQTITERFFDGVDICIRGWEVVAQALLQLNERPRRSSPDIFLATRRG
jgi:hypothetical protein